MSVPSLSFSHVGLFVSDVPRMEDFYTRVMGFTVTDRGVLNSHPEHQRHQHNNKCVLNEALSVFLPTKSFQKFHFNPPS